MRATLSGPSIFALVLAAGLALWPRADARAAAAAEIDPLDLKSEPEQPASSQESPARWLFEVAANHTLRRYELGSQAGYRLSADVFFSRSVGQGWRATVSDRLDHVHPQAEGSESTLNTLREAYLSWQDNSGAMSIDIGRVNVRSGPGYGYNPTDFFRDGSLRSITNPDPLVLRQSRQGTFLLRGQRLWQGGSVAGMVSPKLASHPGEASFSLDTGSTNNRDRGLIVLGQGLREGVSGQLLLYKESGESPQLGASLTALAGPSVVAHLEWSGGREPTLAARAWGLDERRRAQRFAGGATWNSESKLSLTTEYQYNGFAMRKAEWAATAGSVDSILNYLLEADRRQDLAARRALLVYVQQKDLGMRGLDLTAFQRRNLADQSRMSWVELRRHWQQVELAVQLQMQQGRPTSEFGIVPYRRSWQVVASYRL